MIRFILMFYLKTNSSFIGCEITTDELYEDNKPKLNGLRDPRLGVSSRLGRCASCNQTWSKCSGHFGHYEFPHPVYNIGWIPEVLQWLRHSCRHCGHVSTTVLNKKCPSCQKNCPKYMKANAVTHESLNTIPRRAIY